MTFSLCSKLVAASLKMLEEGGRQGNKLETCSEKFRAKGLLKKETELAFVARRLQWLMSCFVLSKMDRDTSKRVEWPRQRLGSATRWRWTLDCQKIFFCNNWLLHDALAGVALFANPFMESSVLVVGPLTHSKTDNVLSQTKCWLRTWTLVQQRAEN